MIWFAWVLWHINHGRLFNAKSSLYIYIKYVLFGWVLRDINHLRLFNTKSSLYISIKYIGFGLVGFYGISTIVDYLMLNLVYTYILNMICKHILFLTFLNEPKFILVYTVPSIAMYH